MPAAVPVIAAYVGSNLFIGTVGAYAATWVSAAVGGLVAFGVSKVMGLDDVPGQSPPGVRGTVKGSVQPIPIVYGTRIVGGTLAQTMTTSKSNNTINVPDNSWTPGTNNVSSSIDNKIMNIVCCWCEGEVDSITVFLNGTATSHETYAEFVTVENYLGTTTQTASPGFLAALAKTYNPPSADKFWTTEHRLLGIAYSYVHMTYDYDTFAGGLPTLSAQVRGRKILDVRDSVTRWSDNPALIIYDYMTNDLFGMGIAASEIDTDSFIDAANYCDQIILVPGVNVSQARYACNATLNPDETQMENLRILLSSCRGALVFSGGAYKLMIDKPDVSTFALTEDNIVGGWNIILESTDSRYNHVKAQFPNKFQKYEDDFVFIESDEYLLADGRELEARIDLQSVTDPYQASQLCGIVLRQSRYSLECEVVCTIAGLQCEVFDVVSVTHELPGWTNQLFRVMQISMESDDNVRLHLRQYADAVYDLDSLNEADSPPPTNLPKPESLLPVRVTVNLALGYYGADLTVAAPDYVPVATIYLTIQGNNAFLSGYIVAHSKDPTQYGWVETFISAEASQGDSFGYTLEDVPNSRWVYIRARPVSVSGTAGDWSSIALPNGRFPLYTYWPVIDTFVPNVRAIGHPSGVLLRWDRTSDSPTIKTEIRRAGFLSGIVEPSTATRVAVVDGESYIDPVPFTVSAATVYLYWVQYVDTYGQEGGFYPPIAGRSGLREYVDDAAAGADGLEAGDLYKLSTGEVISKL